MVSELKEILLNDSFFIPLYEAGFIVERIALHRKIYLFIVEQKENRGISTNQAVNEAMAKFRKARSTIFYAYSRFNT